MIASAENLWRDHLRIRSRHDASLCVTGKGASCGVAAAAPLCPPLLLFPPPPPPPFHPPPPSLPVTPSSATPNDYISVVGHQAVEVPLVLKLYNNPDQVLFFLVIAADEIFSRVPLTISKQLIWFSSILMLESPRLIVRYKNLRACCIPAAAIGNKLMLGCWWEIDTSEQREACYYHAGWRTRLTTGNLEIHCGNQFT